MKMPQMPSHFELRPTLCSCRAHSDRNSREFETSILATHINSKILKSVAIVDEREIEIVIEPKIELNDVKSDDEFLNDDIDNDTDFLYNNSDVIKRDRDKDEFFNDGRENDVFYDSNWEAPNDNADSDLEIVSVVDEKHDIKITVDAPAKARKRKVTSKDGPESVKRKTDVSIKKEVNSVQEDLKVFKITKLNHEEQLAEIHRRQDTDNFKNSPHKCMLCFKGFGTTSTYASHMRRHSDIFGQFQCPICKMYFKTNGLLRHHSSQSHSKRFSCKSCPLVTNHKNSAVNHGRWHRGLKFKCPHCDEEYSKKTTYLSHLRIWHPSDVVCTMCGYSFVNAKGLKMHINFKHRFENVQNPDGPLCVPCNIRFTSIVAYQQHLSISSMHTPSKLFVRRNEPNVPKRTPSKPIWETELVECEQCGIKLKGFKLYNYHFKRFHPEKSQTQFPPHLQKPLLCEHCGKSFKMAFALRDHVLVAHSASKDFQCDVCNKKYSLRSNLISHLKTHAEPPPTFGCPTCGKKFSLKANMKRHILTHKVLKPFKCHACEKTFVNASERSNHVLHSHLKKPWPKKNRGPRVRASRSRHTKEVCAVTLPTGDDSAGRGDDSE